MTTAKLLLSVRLPATLESYEVRVPYDMRVDEGAALVSRLLAAREPFRYDAQEDACLTVLGGSGGAMTLNPNETFRDLVLDGVLVNGSQVLLA